MIKCLGGDDGGVDKGEDEDDEVDVVDADTLWFVLPWFAAAGRYINPLLSSSIIMTAESRSCMTRFVMFLLLLLLLLL